MAYRKRYKKSYRKNSGGGRSNGGMGMYNPGNEFLAGVAAGYSGIVEKHVNDEIVVAAAVLPVKGARGITNFAKGVVSGRLLRARMGNGAVSNTPTGGTF